MRIAYVFDGTVSPLAPRVVKRKAFSLKKIVSMINKKLMLMVFGLAPVENATTRRFQIKSPLTSLAGRTIQAEKSRYTELLRLVYSVPAG